MKRGNLTGEPYAGKWDYDGSLDPLSSKPFAGMETFTLGCWQWTQRRTNGNGKGLKAGKVQYRVKGYVSDPHEAHRRAREWCEAKNAKEAGQ